MNSFANQLPALRELTDGLRDQLGRGSERATDTLLKSLLHTDPRLVPRH